MIEHQPSARGEAPKRDEGRGETRRTPTGSVALTGTRGSSARGRVEGAHTFDRAPRSTPAILPPATIDHALASEAARIRREVARARGEALPPDHPEPASTVPTSAVVPAAVGDDLMTPTDMSVEAVAPSDLATAFSEATDRAAAPGATSSEIDALFEDADDDDLLAPTDSGATAAPWSSGGATTSPDQSVAEIAAVVIEHMRAMSEANERHLEALALEAARRCELITAAAELDAELIRLNARREAHAVVAAARGRAGDSRASVEADQLSDIGETFSRFAESIESTITSSSDPFDLPRTP